MTHSATYKKVQIEVSRRDIVALNVDAIVNAASTFLLGGGGVDGAIHRAAGPELREECRLLNGCEIGSAKITKAYNLPAKYVIHVVGPVWEGGVRNELELLASCYRGALLLAEKHEVSSVAFPAISCGAFGFPLPEAAAIAVREVRAQTNKKSGLTTVIFAAFSEEVFRAYQDALR